MAENRKKYQEKYKGEAYVWRRINKHNHENCKGGTIFLVDKHNHEHISGGESQKKSRKIPRRTDKSGGIIAWIRYFLQKIKKIDPIKGGGAKKQQNQMKP